MLLSRDSNTDSWGTSAFTVYSFIPRVTEVLNLAKVFRYCGIQCRRLNVNLYFRTYLTLIVWCPTPHRFRLEFGLRSPQFYIPNTCYPASTTSIVDIRYSFSWLSSPNFLNLQVGAGEWNCNHGIWNILSKILYLFPLSACGPICRLW